MQAEFHSIWSDSKFIKLAAVAYNYIYGRMLKPLWFSLGYFKVIIRDVIASDMRSLGLFLAVVISVNIILIFLLGKEVSLLDWFARALLLLASFACMFSDAGLRDTRSTSILLKWFDRSRKPLQ